MNDPPFIPAIGSASSLAIVDAGTFLQAPPPVRKYLLSSVLPLGEVGMIVGASGIGKSMFTLQLGLSVATGIPVCGGLYQVENAGAVLMVNAEDDQDEMHRRFWHLAHGLAMPLCSDAVNCTVVPPPNISKNAAGLKFCSLKAQSASFLDEDGKASPLYEQVLDAARQITELRLIVLDPLRRMFDGSEDSSDTAARLIPLIEKLAKDTGATVLLVHHMSKQSAKQGTLDQYSAKGSGAFTDLVRWQLNIASLKKLGGTGLLDDYKYGYLEVSVSKNNYGPPQTERLFLQRCDKGVLQYVHSSGNQGKVDKDVEVVVGVIQAEFNNDKVYSKTELRKLKEQLGMTLGQKAISDAIELGIEQGLLELVKRPNHKGKGKHPMDVVPAKQNV